MNFLRISLQRYVAIAVLFGGAITVKAADTPFTAPEITTATLACSAQWNEYCEDKKIISVPEGYKLCSQKVTVGKQEGNSTYNLLSSDAKTITIGFNAKGNRDRLKPQNAVIELSVSLHGVRENIDCSTGTNADKPVATNHNETAITATPVAIKEQHVVELPKEEPKEIIKPVTGVNACACSAWMDGALVANCLTVGHGRDNKSCGEYQTTIQCVADKDICRELHKKSCPQEIGLNQMTSKKRIYIENSPFCKK